MRKFIRTWVKQEKRIVKLAYKKGLLKDFKTDDFYWQEYRSSGRKERRRNGKKYSFTIYLPEIHYCVFDYWGEADEYSVVESIRQQLHWDNLTEPPSDENGGWGVSEIDGLSRQELIEYLKKLPTVINDSKINEPLRYWSEI